MHRRIVQRHLAARRSLCASAVVLCAVVLMSACAQSASIATALSKTSCSILDTRAPKIMPIGLVLAMGMGLGMARVIGAIHSVTTVFLRSIWASGVWVVWRIRRIWCSASAVRCAGPSSHASEPCPPQFKKNTEGLPRSSNDREPPKVPTASLVVTPIESVLYPFQYGLVSKVIRHRLPLHVDVRMLRVSSGVMCVHPRGMREYHANQAIGDDARRSSRTLMSSTRYSRDVCVCDFS